MKRPTPLDRSPSQREAWNHIRPLLPPDPELERLAREKGAICRRRGVKAAAALVRLLLSYACCTLSFEGVCEWAEDSGWASLSRNAFRNRLHRASPLLEHLLCLVLGKRSVSVSIAGRRVMLADGTRFSPPGTRGSGWCAHSLLDPWSGRTLQLELTDKRGGEHLRRFRFSAGDLVIADAGYAHRRGLAYMVEQGAEFLVRTNWCNLPFQRICGRPFDLFKAAGRLEEGQRMEFPLQIAADKDHGIPALPVRLLVYRKSQQATEAAQKKARAEARRTKRQINPRTLEACKYILLVTNVRTHQLDASRLLDLYRLRWQIELGFKRWKSLLRLDDLNVRHPRSVRATLTAKLLGAVLVEEIVDRQHTGEGLWQQTRRVGEAFRHALLGERAVSAVLTAPSCRHVPKTHASRPRQRTLLRDRLCAISQSPQPSPITA
ncbi:MAG: IS4 family transposase [Candidatus Sericytochromatia bacterium]